MKRVSLISMLIPVVVLAMPSVAAADDGPCGGFQLQDGQVITKNPLPAAAPLPEDAKLCLRAVAALFAQRPYVRSITVAARVPDQQRANGDGIKLAMAVTEVLAEAGLPKTKLSAVAPSIGHGQSAGILLAYREGRSERRIARILGVTGTARHGRVLDTMRAAKRKDDLGVYEYVDTAADSSVLMRLADRSTLIVGENTTLRLGKLTLDNNLQRQVQLELVKGEIFTFAAPGQTSASFEIRTRTAVAGVRGTSFRTSVDDAQTARIETHTGAVELNSDTGQSVAVNKGFGSLSRPGQAPLEPRSLLPGAIIKSPLKGAAAAPVDLEWKPVANAVSYRIELARDAQFTRELKRQESPTQKLTLSPSFPSGKWFWRVQAIDSDGLMGMPSKIYAFDVRRGSKTAPSSTSP